MNTQRKSTKMMRESARVVATELIKQPVKEAVREALREEAVTVKSGSDATQTDQHGEGSATIEQHDSPGGPSKITILGTFLALAGVAFLARRRLSSGSTWSEPSPGAVSADDAETGYSSEGEMQTTETAGDSGGDTGGTGTSPSTTTDQ